MPEFLNLQSLATEIEANELFRARIFGGGHGLSRSFLPRFSWKTSRSNNNSCRRMCRVE